MSIPKKPTTPKKPVTINPKPVVTPNKPVLAPTKPAVAPKAPVAKAPVAKAPLAKRPVAPKVPVAHVEGAPTPKVLLGPTVKHTWTRKDTYAELAFKYYGSMEEPYWRLIYESNKDIIGNHPNDIKVGLEISIPPLPPELKKK